MNSKRKFNRKRGHFKHFRQPDQKINEHGKNEKFFESLSESQLGITEYIGQSIGFIGIIKSRYNDFHVNEIDLDGNMAKLTNLAPLTLPKEEKIETLRRLDLECYLVEKNLVTQEQWDEITKLNKHSGDSVEIDVTHLTKQQRTEIHDTIKLHWNGELITNTVSNGDKKHIKCLPNTKNNKERRQEKWLWPGEYLHFILHKVNIDTMQASANIAFKIGCKPSSITYAGTKDKRAVTSQWLCIKKRQPDVIIKATNSFPFLQVGNFHYKTAPLKLGQLKGNNFRIALRNITASHEILEESINSIKFKGFINYYGLQRFGNCAEIPTYEIGKALLKSQWNTAVELILKPRNSEPPYMRKMREVWWETRDPEAALNVLFRGNKSIEARLLGGLVVCGKSDYLSALSMLPRNNRLLYIHSYQSLIWNKIASRRIKTWGLNVREGDLVYVDDPKIITGTGDIFAELHEIDDVEDEQEAEDKDENKKDNDLSVFKGLARQITAEDISSGKYKISDIVLPLPGHDILYPNNETYDWYKEYIQEDGLDIDNFKQNVKLYSLPGSYRKLIEIPQDLEWSVKTYNTPEETLLESDIELLEKCTEISGTSNNTNSDVIPCNEQKAVILEFKLSSSCYATMALREILKIDTSTSNQIKLNVEKNNEQDVIKSDCKGVELELDITDTYNSTAVTNENKRSITDTTAAVDVKKQKIE